MPATLVEIGLKLLLGLGSQVSMWLGPPSSQKRITEVAFPGTGEVAAACRYSLSVRPRNPSEPTLRKSRRELGWLAILSSYVHFLLSVILRKFASADQSPDEFPKSRRAITTPGQDF